VVLCALPVEYQAVRPLLIDLELKELPGGSLFEEGMLPGTPWRVALGQLGEGNVGAGILAERAMRSFNPDLVLFVGIAGALKDDVLVGDVVVATRIDAYQGGKAAEDFLARPRTWDADHRLEQRARHLAVTDGWPPAGLIRVDGAAPVAHFKPIAAGDVVLASRDSLLYEQLRLHYNDAVAIEMEGAGLAQAAHVNDALPVLVIRGISDTTGPDKHEFDAAGWQPRAAGHAASFAAALLHSLSPASLPRHQAAPGGGTAGTPGPAGRIVRLPADRRHLPDLAGEQDLLAGLDQQLTHPDSGDRLPVVLTGIGGVGKTQLTVEHAHTHREALDVVWTVRAEDPAIAGQDYAALAAALHLPGSDNSDLTAVADLTRAWLSSHDRWLLICDNASNAADIDPLLPGEISGQVLVTSRNPAWPPRYARLGVDTLPVDTAATLLLGRTRQTDQASAQLLADDLGGLPLALEQAAAYCTQTGLSLTRYQQLYRTTPAKLLDKASQPGQATVTGTVTLAAQHVRDLDLAAAALLDLLAYLAPDAIPRALLAGTQSDDDAEAPTNGDDQASRPPDEPVSSSSSGASMETASDSAPATENKELSEQILELLAPLDALEDDLALNDAIGLLHRYGLLTATPDTLTVHRLTQTVLRASHSALQHYAFALAAASVVWDALPEVGYTTWPVYQQLLPHALAAADHAADLPEPEDNSVALLLAASAYLADRGRSAAAEPIATRALKLSEAQAGSDDADIIFPLLLLGRIRRDRGHAAAAQPLFERALAIAEASYGPDHPDLFLPLNNLGNVLRDRGDPAAAQPLLERAVAIAEASYGPDHPNLILPQ
jgi:nucleoside phosphorylase/tetratricopeptide (TPR) repeat protein